MAPLPSSISERISVSEYIAETDNKSKAISSVPSKSSSFTNPIDVEYITTAQQKTIFTEVSNNIPKLKGKLSDNIINKMNTYVNSELATLK